MLSAPANAFVDDVQVLDQGANLVANPGFGGLGGWIAQATTSRPVFDQRPWRTLYLRPVPRR
jgi:hypothetical protein